MCIIRVLHNIKKIMHILLDDKTKLLISLLLIFDRRGINHKKA